MAENSGYFVDLNKLRRLKDGSVGTPEKLFFGEKEIMMAFTTKGKVYNKALYYMKVEDILIEASGNPVEAEVTSYKTDFDGKVSEVGYSGHIVDVEPNYLEQEVYGTFTVTQSVSGLEVVGKYTQAPDFSVISYSDLNITSVIYMQIPAYGGTSNITIGYTMTEKTTWASGKEEYRTIGGSTTSFSSINGKSLSNGTFNSDGSVSATNLYGEPRGETAVAQISSVSISVNGLSTTWYGTVYCYQRENIETAGSSYYTVTCDAKFNSCTAVRTAIDFSVSATKTTHYSYTSGYETDKTVNATATMTTNLGTLSSYTITGSGTTTLTLDGNTSTTSSRTATVVATCADGTYASDYVTQAADVVRYEWGAPYITEILCQLDVQANGMGVPVSASYTQTQYRVSVASGRTEYATDSGTKNVASISGTSLSNNAKVSGAVVSADSLGSTVKDRTAVYDVTSVTLTANGVTGTSSGKTLKVYQAANAIVSTSSAYSLSLSASGTPVSALGGSATISVAAYRTDTHTYTSGSTKEADAVNATATLSTTGGTLGATSLSGANSTTLSFGENFSQSEGTYTVTAKCSDQTKTTTVKQSAATYEFKITSLTPSVGADGGDVSLTVTSKRNGKEQSFNEDNVSVSGLSGVKKSVTNHGGGSFSVVLGVPPNEETEGRSFTVTLTQPNSGETASTTVTQSGAVDDRDDVFIRLTASASSDYATVSYSVQFQATNTTLYQGGELNNVYVRLGTEDGSELVAEKLLASQIVVAEGSSSSTYSGSLNNRLGSDVWVHVFYNNGIQKSMQPVAISI